MKRKGITSLVGTALLATAGAVLAWPSLPLNRSIPAESPKESVQTMAVEHPSLTPTTSANLAALQSVTQFTEYDPLQAPICSDATIKANAEMKSPFAKAKGRRIAAVSDLAGDFIMLYSSLTNDVGSGGLSVNVSTVGNDSIIIAGFWQPTLNVKAKVDVAAGTVTIPAQYLYTHSTYGDMWLALCTTEGKPDYSQPLTGKINANGTFTIDSWWGVFVKSGTSAGGFMVAAHNTAFGRPNATMQCDLATGGSETFGVFVQQPMDNNVTVINFGNNGMMVEIDLNYANSGSIKSQVVREYPTNGDFMSYAVGEYVTTTTGTSIKGLSNPIYLDTLATKQTNTLSWGPWTAISQSYSSSLFLKPWTSGKITMTTPVTFPELTVSELKGSGTEADPFQIASRDDLVFLSVQVQESTETNPNFPQYVSAYRGKYFKVMNDIDMSGTKFTPIGADMRHRFAGNFDGNGKKISNLKIERNVHYNGLFGNADTISSFKNVTLVNPDITAEAHYAGALVAWSYGPIDNCHVIGGQISCAGQVSGGLVGSASGGLTNSSVNGVTVMTLGGWGGGLVGQVQTSFVNCHAINTTVYGYPGSGYSMGGLAGMILCDADRLYFSGIADGNRLGAPDGAGVYNGAIAGVLNGSKLTNAFAVGTVLGRGSKCKVGGLFGIVQGASVDNAFFHGRVGTYYSKMTGGLVGHVMAKSNDGGIITNNFKNMYVSAYVDLEDYQYNRATGWAETLGQVDEGALGTAENICYNRQMFTENSQNGTALTTDQLTSGTPLAGFSTDTWNFVKDQYPTLKATGASNAADLAASAILLSEGTSINKVSKNMKLSAVGSTSFSLILNGQLSQTGHAAKIEGDSLKLTTFGRDTLVFINGATNFSLPMRVAPVPFEGMGSETSPYLIRTKADLIALSKFANEDGQYFPETYFLQTNDIDLENDPAFKGIATVANDAHCRFAGIYDGGGYTIHRFKVPGLVWQTPPTATELGKPKTGTGGSEGYKGFIGRLDIDGQLKNLNFAADCDASETWASVGVAVGDNYGLIQNVRNYADITAVSCWVGGIAGMNEVEGKIIDCYNAGDVISGYNNAGGISGRNNGIIENCANTGYVAVRRIAIFGSNYNVAGGITTSMSNGVVKNVLNVGLVEANSTAGGLVASLVKSSAVSNGPGKNDIIGGINLGTVRSTETAMTGYIAGISANNNRADGTILVYYDDQIANCNAYGNESWQGMNGMSTAQLTSGAALEGLDPAIWQFDKGMYPVLKKFADEPELVAARKIILTLPEGITVRDLTQNGTLSTDSEWTLDNSSYFSIDGNTLKTGTAPSTLENAVLTGKLNGFEKPIDLTRMPPVPLQGEGTQATPYLISNTTDWNNLAAYINTIHDTFEGKFLKVTADITFEAGQFTPLFSDPADMLQGTLDGDNHVIDGVSMTTTDRYQAPIRAIGKNGILKNLTMKGSFSSAKAYTGAFTGNVYGTVINCVNEVALTVTTGSGASAFGQAYENAVFERCINKAHITGASTFVAGLVSDALVNVTFTDCGNEGVIESKYSGSAPSSRQGIAGIVATAISPKMTRCYNIGSFKFAKPEVMFGVAGILGYAKSNNTNKDTLVMNGCYNKADIEAGWMVGGLVADMDASGTIKNYMKFNDCYNTGNLKLLATASKTNGTIAGISVLYAPGATYTNCYNTGKIDNTNAKQAYAAGIVAYYKMSPTAAEPLTITGCYNTGDITAAYNFAGGIIGYQPLSYISDCYNTGNIKSLIGAGGIAGNFSHKDGIIERCWNSGNITVSESRAGGIAGQNNVKSTMTDCFNIGSIENTATTLTVLTNGKVSKGYGVGGVIGEGGGIVTRCYNMGEVKGIANVGGIIGRPYANNTNVASCYNAGVLSAPADTCGNIIGASLVDNGLIWKETNSIKDCYWYVAKTEAAQAAENVTTPEGKQLTEAELAAFDMGEGWTNVKYTFPLLTNLSNDQAKVWASRAIPGEKDLKTGIITESFFIGIPEGVSWTSSVPDYMQIDHRTVRWIKPYTGAFVMTVKCGDYSRNVNLNGDVPSGIDGIGDGREIISETFFSLDGVQIAKPENPGQVYIMVRKYSDGTSSTQRIVAK